MTLSRRFFRASQQLHVFALSFDRLTGLSYFFGITYLIENFFVLFLFFASQNGWIISKDVSGETMQSDKTARVILVVLFAVFCVFNLCGDAFIREGRTIDLKAFLRKKAFPKSSRSSIIHRRNGYQTNVLQKVLEMDTKPYGE